MTIVNIKPHHFTKLVGELRDVAIKFGHTQQLRERIAYALGKYVKPDHPHSTPAQASIPAQTIETLLRDVKLEPVIGAFMQPIIDLTDEITGNDKKRARKLLPMVMAHYLIADGIAGLEISVGNLEITVNLVTKAEL